jgi:hypothetical protein
MNSLDLHSHLLSLPILHISRAAHAQKNSTILPHRCSPSMRRPSLVARVQNFRPRATILVRACFQLPSPANKSAIFTPTRLRSKGPFLPPLVSTIGPILCTTANGRGVYTRVCLLRVLKRSLHRFPTCCAAAVSFKRSARRQVFPERRPKQHQVCLARTAAGSQQQY